VNRALLVLVRFNHVASVIEIDDRIILPLATSLIWQADKSNNGVTFLVRRGDRESATFGNAGGSNV
jgi:hypothetical protein